MKVSRVLAIVLAMISFSLPACNKSDAESLHKEHQNIVVTSPIAKDVVVTRQYVCQIHSRNHIKIRALKTDGYLEAIPIKEGQLVKKGDVLFQIVPTLYKARLDAEVAEVQLAELEWKNAQRLFNEKPPIISQVEVALFAAKLAKANAKKKLAEAEMNFATVRAPFDGIVDRLLEQQGSLIKEGEALTTLSDNSVMWVYFNVPEARYLEDMTGVGQDNDSREVELVLADGKKFPQSCSSIRKEAQFNNETGNIPYRADFPNPDRLLRHGQTGNILIHRTLKNAIVIPQRATFEILDKRYVWVVDKDNVVHQRLIDVLFELDDIFVVKKEEPNTEVNKKEEHNTEDHKKEMHKKGLDVDDKIILEGVRQVRDGDKVEYESIPPEKALANQKQHAE